MTEPVAPYGVAKRNKALLLHRWKPYPAYKDSGIEWLGQIPAHWEGKRLKRELRIINGATPKSSEDHYWDGDIPWVTPEDLGALSDRVLTSTARFITKEGYESCGTTLVLPGSLVLSTRAPIGHLGIAGVYLCTNQGCRSLVFRYDSDKYFFYYQLLAANQELKSLGQGSTFLELGASKLAAVWLAVPPYDEQKTIADFLDYETAKIDALINKIRQHMEKLREYRTALISAVVTGKVDVREEAA